MIDNYKIHSVTDKVFSLQIINFEVISQNISKSTS